MSFATCMKSTCDTVKGYMSAALRSKNEAAAIRDSTVAEKNAAHAEALAAKASAETAASKAAEVAGYVIPTQATYSKDEIDSDFATLGALIWRNKAKIEGLDLHLI